MTDNSDKAPKKVKKPLTRGWKKQQLIRELAQGDKLQQQLAREYGVSQGRISQFKTENAVAIEQCRLDMENEFAALWIARKLNRLAEYEADVEELNKLPKGSRSYRDKHRALRQAAEELGHLPNRVTLAGEVNARVRYLVDGVDDEALK